MVAADSDHIKKEYEILLNELKMYNPELLNKERVLAITKSDIIDDELEKLLEKITSKKSRYCIHFCNDQHEYR